MSFDLDSYNTVNERIEEFRSKHPEGTIQSELMELPAAFADRFIAVRTSVYRTPDDPRPGIAMAWETVPGKTNFTRESELMNAETSAIGRALIAVGAADAKKGIASQNEVRARQESSSPAARPTPAPNVSAATQPALAENACDFKFEDGAPCVRPLPHKMHARPTKVSA